VSKEHPSNLGYKMEPQNMNSNVFGVVEIICGLNYESSDERLTKILINELQS
jgi:hypothetical protein